MCMLIELDVTNGVVLHYLSDCSQPLFSGMVIQSLNTRIESRENWTLKDIVRMEFKITKDKTAQRNKMFLF